MIVTVNKMERKNYHTVVKNSNLNLNLYLWPRIQNIALLHNIAMETHHLGGETNLACSHGVW